MAQLFVGYFFASAAYFKLTDSFFGLKTATLGSIFQGWIELKYPVSWYVPFMEFALPHIAVLAILTIAIQFAAGIALLYDAKVKWFMIPLFLVQLNILLAVWHGHGFIVFVGISLWLCGYYFFRDTMTNRTWTILTLWLAFYMLFLMWDRYLIGDASPASFAWQFQHFQHDVMSTTPALKHWIVAFTKTSAGQFLWTASWWITLVLGLGMLIPRIRLYAGAGMLVYVICRTLMWTTAVTSEGTLWVLVLFVWVAEEERRKRELSSKV